MASKSSSRAEKPRAPVLRGAALRALLQQKEKRVEREHAERCRMLRAALWVMLIVVGASLLRGGWGRVFVPGWWRQW